MNETSALIAAVAAGDMTAAETLVCRYSGPLFRFCRLNFTDHYRAGEFIEEFMAGWLSRLQCGDTEAHGIVELFERACRQSQGQWAGERGRGLSAKQRRILEILEHIPLKERLALDLLCLEDRTIEQISAWLDIDADSIRTAANTFFAQLSTDETIKEILTHASIHQIRAERTATQRDRSRPVSREKRLETRFGQENPQKRPPGFSDRRRAGPEQTHIRAGGRPGSQAEEDGRGNAGGERRQTYEERQKSRARRRRVDPRQLDFDI